MRLPFRTALRLGVILPALALPALAGAQNYSDLPPLAPLGEAEVRALPPEYRTAPASVAAEETVTTVDGVETITRTRRIDVPRRPLPAAPAAPQYAPVTYAPAPAVFERDQWIAECDRRIGKRHKKDRDRYDCEAALDSYLSQHGAAGQRIASREIAYPAYAPPSYGYSYGYPQAYGYYSYAPPPQVVLVPVRSEVQQQVVVRETERFETYTVPGAVPIVPEPAPHPSPKLIKGGR